MGVENSHQGLGPLVAVFCGGAGVWVCDVCVSSAWRLVLGLVAHNGPGAKWQAGLQVQCKSQLWPVYIS